MSKGTTDWTNVVRASVLRGEVRLLSVVLVRGRYAKGRQARVQRVFESSRQALLFGALGIVASSLLYWVHPLFGGMALLASVVVAFILVSQGAGHASDEIPQRLAL